MSKADWSTIDPPKVIRLTGTDGKGQSIWLDDVELPFHVALGSVKITSPEGYDAGGDGWAKVQVELVAWERVIDEREPAVEDEEETLFDVHEALSGAENVDPL